MSDIALTTKTSETRPGDWAVFSLVVGVPLALFILMTAGLMSDPVWPEPEMHFYSVTLIALVAVCMAVFMAISATSLKDTRVFLLSIAYLSSSVVLLTHAITTPGVLVEANPWVGISGDLGVLLAGMFLALSSVEWSSGFQRRVLHHARPILWAVSCLLVGFLSFAMLSSYMGFADSFAFLTGERIVEVVTYLMYGLLWFSLIRYVQLCRRYPGPVLFGVIASILLLIQTVVSMTNADIWLASWWIHHLMLLGAFAAVVLGIGLQFRRRSTLRGVLEGLLLRDSLIQVEREYTDAIIALVAAVEARDPYTHGHSSGVAEISERIGRKLGLKGEALEMLHLSALLHDIGKLGIPDEILLKPASLTEIEFAAIKEHPARGEEIVSRIGALKACAPGIRWHHERLDGSGYPDGLKDDEIPLYARIIAVADSYDAMTSERPYRGPMSHERALQIIRQESGVKLDPLVVEAFIEVIGLRAAGKPTAESSALAAA